MAHSPAEDLWKRAATAEETQQDLHAALHLYTHAEAAGHNADACASARWRCHMLLGDYESAWRESDAIEHRGHPDPNRFWDRQSLDGRRVIIRCLHGLGDTLQYIRFAPLLRERTKSLTIEAQPQLKTLLQAAGIADHVITWGDPEPQWDTQIEIVELPRIFRATLGSLPNQTPYLKVERAAPLPPCTNPLRVGLVWESGAFNPTRSIPFAQFATLLEAPGVCFYSLQAGEARHAIDPWSNTVPSLYKDPGDALPTAEILNALHLIVTVDTMPAHLAGALGRPVWTILPFHCDWRWMLHRTDSPWYPTMRLFRNKQPDDWTGVLSEVKQALIDATATAAILPREAH